MVAAMFGELSALVTASVGRLWVRIVGLFRQPLFTNAGYLAAASLVGPLFGFLFWGLAARLYPPEAIGMVTAVLSSITLTSGIADLGVSLGLIRFLSKAQEPVRLLNTAFAFNTLTAFVTGVVFLAGLSLWSPSLMFIQSNIWYVAGFLVFAVVSTLRTVVKMAFVAHRKAQYSLFHICIVNGGRLVLMVALAGFGVVGLAVSAGLSVLLAVVLSLAIFLPRVETGYRLSPDFSWSEFRAVLVYSIGNYAAGLLAQAPQVLSPLLILEMLGPSAGGYASIAWILGMAMSVPGTALARSAFAESSNAPERLGTIFRKAAVVGLGLTVPVSLAMIVGAQRVLYLFRPSYAREALGLLRWLAAAAPLVVIVLLHFARLRVQKQLGRLNVQSGLIAGITVGVSAAFLPKLGIAASGIAWLIGNGLVAGIAIGRVLKETKSQKPERQNVLCPLEND
jgi:O-antigen/teichoic acid export membrane protein